MDFESETFVTVAPTIRAGGNRTGGDRPPGTDVDTVETLIVVPILEAGARTGKSTTDPRAGIGIGEDGDPMFTLQSGKQHAIAFSSKDHGADACEGLAPTLRAGGHSGSHANAGVPPAICFDTTQITSGANYSNPKPGDPCHPLAATAHPPAIAFTERGRKEGRTFESQEELAYCLTNPGSGGRTHSRQVVTPQMGVRRLTPRECERLQGFDDEYTAIAYHGKAAADGPRYKAIGNSMARPVIRWILTRLAEKITAQSEVSTSRRQDQPTKEAA